MRNRGKRTVLGLTILLLAGAGLQCTNSDVLSPAPGQLKLSVQVSPAGSSKYELGSVDLVQLTFRPQDPVADAALGAQPYSLVSSPVRIDLTTSTPFQVSSVGVKPGVYRVVTVRIQGPIAQDFNFTPNPPEGTPCVDKVLAREGVDGKLPPPEILPAQVNVPIDVTGFDPAPTFELVGAEQTTLTLTLDGTAFFTLFQDAFTCRENGSCIRGNQTFPAPCMSLYTSPTPDQILPLIHFQ